jgi:hypothetical protein
VIVQSTKWIIQLSCLMSSLYLCLFDCLLFYSCDFEICVCYGGVIF